MSDKDQLVRDLTPFCDIGEKGPAASEKDGKITAKMLRDGRSYRVVLEESTGRVQVTVAANPTRSFASLSQALASESFANLRRWADSQKEFLKKDTVTSKDLIPIRGVRHDNEDISGVDGVDSLLGAARPSIDSSEVVLLDGPGGIGKTTLIEQIALSRAENYRTSGKPLILHVKSRGRVLSNLQDLMAFSLQTLRLAITYDQIPVLVKHGLVVLAIDGFDELGDPNGYELAWSQINDLVTSIRGKGTLILAGRDTFIGRDRLLRDVKALRENKDVVTEVVLDAPSPEQAKEWLKKTSQWTDASFNLPAVSVLLEPGSYALRPVFLRMLRDQIRPKELKEKSENDLAALLVNHMIEREAKKFGDAVESAMTLPVIKGFVANFLKEVARDMADSQSESVDANALTWIAEAALGDGWSAEIQGLIRNRVQVIAFLADDERPGHRKFSHVQIMNYFLAHVTLEAISGSDFPKYVRRNILGKEFLSTFCDVMLERSGSGDERVNALFSEASRFAAASPQADRSLRNVGALLITALPSFAPCENLRIGGFHVDDVLVKRTVPSCTIHNMVINQLDVRGADLGAAVFDGVVVLRLIVDDSSRLPDSFPNVTAIIDGTGQEVNDESKISELIDRLGRRRSDDELGDSAVPPRLANHEALKLLGRACRLRQHWLRSEGDQHAARIVNDPWWETIAGVLQQHGFLRQEVGKQASGRPSTFYHIRHSDRLLTARRDDEELVSLYADLLEAVEN